MFNYSENSFQKSNFSWKNKLETVWVMIIMSSLSLLHSLYTHRLKYKYVNILTIIGNFSVILSGIFILLAIRFENDSLQLVIYDNCIVKGILTSVIFFTDNYMIYTRFLAVERVTKRFKVLVHIYIIVLLNMIWLPYFTILPIFLNMNSSSATKAFEFSYSKSTLLILYYFVVIISCVY